MDRYGMVIDLRKCIGCNSCVVACKIEHNVPNEISLTSILEKEVGKFPNSNRVFVPVMCNHCEKPPCVEVCPTKATYIREDGIVAIDWEKCIGCEACIEHCPYDARFLVNDNRILFPDGETDFENPVFKKAPSNVTIKCDFCFHRVEKGLPPACVECCQTDARIFGDLSNKEDPIWNLINKYKGWQMLPDRRTEPCVYYIG
jgi:molybdopterin-containing oxidoreductase family iron-sulfur binding subunit